VHESLKDLSGWRGAVLKSYISRTDSPNDLLDTAPTCGIKKSLGGVAC